VCVEVRDNVPKTEQLFQASTPSGQFRPGRDRVRVTVYPARGQVDRRSAQALGMVGALSGRLQRHPASGLTALDEVWTMRASRPIALARVRAVLGIR